MRNRWPKLNSYQTVKRISFRMCFPMLSSVSVRGWNQNPRSKDWIGKTGPEGLKRQKWSITLCGLNYEQLLKVTLNSCFHFFIPLFLKEIRSSFLFHHFPPTSFYPIIITLYWAILGSDGMCDSCRSTRGKLGWSQLQDCVWTPFVNWLLLRVVHRFWYMTDLDCMLTGSTSLLLLVPFHLRATLMHSV